MPTETQRLHAQEDETSARYGAVEDAVMHAPPPPRPEDKISLVNVLLPCIAIWSITLITSVDTTIVSMLVKNISSTFQGAERSSWIGTSFLLSACCTAPLFARLSDLFGRKRSLTMAVIVITIGTVWCSLARSMNEFLVARALAGAGSGGLSTVPSVIMSSIVPLRSRGLFQGLTNIVYGLGIGLGAPIGGMLNDAIGWRGAFYVQLPLMLLSLLFIVTLLPLDPPVHLSEEVTLRERMKKIDLLGLILYTSVPLSLLLALNDVGANAAQWTDPTVAGSLCVAAVAVLGLFVVERRAEFPMVSFEVLSLRSCWSVLGSNFWFSVALFSFNFNFPLYFQVVAHLMPSTIGLRMIPGSIAVAFGSLAAGLYLRHSGRYYKFTLACALSMVLATAPMARYLLDPPTVSPFVLYAILTASQSAYLASSLVAIVHCASQKTLAVATGMTYLFRITGQVLGVAMSGALLQVVLLRALRERIIGPGAEELIEQVRHDTSVLAALPDDLRQSAIESYAEALHYVLMFVALSFALTFVFVGFMDDKHLDEEHGLQDDDAPAGMSSDTSTTRPR